MQQYYGKKSDVMIKVPKGVKNTALNAFKLRDLGFKGGIETGWQRAKQLSTKESISIEDIRYMRNWFARHIFVSYPGYNNWVKAGKPKDDKYWYNKRSIIAWEIWGGDEAFKWINKKSIIDILNKEYDKVYTKIV